MAPRRRPRPRPIDLTALAESMAGPGRDTRQWVSFGLVTEEPVDFDPDHGPLVPVNLVPSEVEVLCRVAMQVGGNGEGEYYPFVEGDEVLVLVPGGNERGGCVIVGRLPNQRTPFPQTSVAGQDPSNNNFGFRRTKAPFTTEADGPMMMRQAASGAFLSLDAAGTVTLSNGERSALQLSADALTIQSGDGRALLQLDLTGSRGTLQMGSAVLTLADSTASPATSSLVTPSVLQLAAAGAPPAEHVTTAEAVYNIFASVMAAFSAYLLTLPPAPLTTTSLAALLAPPAFSTTVLAPSVLLAVTPLNPTVAAALVAYFATASGKPPAVPGQGQVLPGLGCAGLLAG